jgi:small GTP-binding protein
MATYQVALIGARGVGKTCLFRFFTGSPWDSDYVPSLGPYLGQPVFHDNVEFKLIIYDMSGQDKIAVFVDFAIKAAHVCVILYSVTSQESFDEAELYRSKVIQFAAGNPVRIVLAATKCDLPDRAVTRAAGEELARKWGCEFFEISAKENLNVAELFQAALRTIVSKAGAKKESDSCCSVA